MLEAVTHFAALAEAIASQREMKAILRAFSEHLPNLLPFDRSSLSVVAGGHSYTWHIKRGGAIEEVSQLSVQQQGSLVDTVMSNDGVIIVDDIGREPPHFREEADLLAEGSRSLISYRLSLEGRVIGTMNVESRRRSAYSQNDAPIIKLIANQLAVAVERSHVFGEQERRLDDVGGQLIRAGKMATVGQLAAVVAHEVKNRFNAIQLGAQFLQRQLAPAPTDEAGRTLASILRSVEQGTRLMRDLLDYAKPAAPRFQSFALAETLQEALRLARKADIQVDWAVPPSLPMAWGDPSQLGQVFVNLILNAIEAMPNGGKLRLAGTTTDGSVEIAIRDTGVGIPPENRERIFEPFFTTKKAGTGLGMSISRSIVEANGGQITVDSQPGVGSTFTITLPQAREHRAAA
jgi:signal transduction histidine kinase